MADEVLAGDVVTPPQKVEGSGDIIAEHFSRGFATAVQRVEPELDCYVWHHSSSAASVASRFWIACTYPFLGPHKSLRAKQSPST